MILQKNKLKQSLKHLISFCGYNYINIIAELFYHKTFPQEKNNYERFYEKFTIF